jgi:hypothetical protein
VHFHFFPFLVCCTEKNLATLRIFISGGRLVRKYVEGSNKKLRRLSPDLNLGFERRISGQASSGSDDPGQSGFVEHFRRHHPGQVPDDPVADGPRDL